MKDLKKGSKIYFNAVSKLVAAGEDLVGKKAQSTVLRSYIKNLNMMQMNPTQKITDYIVEEQMTEPKLFIVFDKITVAWETLWNVKSK